MNNSPFVYKVYNEVIDDVITQTRESFLEDGVDEQVIQEFKQAWVSKLLATKAVNPNPSDQELKLKKVAELTNGFPKAQQPTQVIKHVQINNYVPAPITHVVEQKMVPIQITLPTQAGSEEQRILSIQVPSFALQNNQLQKVLTSAVISATLHLPPPIASALLQQHVNAALASQQQAVTIIDKPALQTDGADSESSEEDETVMELAGASTSHSKTDHKLGKMKKKLMKALLQHDGSQDTSDDDEDGSEQDEESDEVDDDKDEQDPDNDGPEEDPLNSDDDVTDEDATDVFDTDNVVVCQFDKITKSRNKWKFHLKDGIMNLKGEDFLFQKANGDAEW